jgi:3'-phosphoadenosine 5'-phosphosulfate sulfotransferase (PAPS reductase)/FAD synthetase
MTSDSHRTGGDERAPKGAAPEPFPALKLDAERVLIDAIVEHEPRKVFALFSGGNDSTVLTSWARMTIGHRLDAAVYIDTGTAIPGVRDFVEDYCKLRQLPLLVYEAGDEYDRMVAEHGFPGPGSHRFAYVRLKERQIDALVRDHKQHPRDRILLLTGVRRAESVRRMGTTAPVRRDGAQVWVAPLVDWTNEDMRSFRVRHNLPQSDVAALLHRSGECNCGAFAKPGEREELRSLFPSWWEERIAPLELVSGRLWGERPLRNVPIYGDLYPCPVCKGSGVDPTEGGYCDECGGDGEILPIIGYRKPDPSPPSPPGPLCQDCQLGLEAA